MEQLCIGQRGHHQLVCWPHLVSLWSSGCCWICRAPHPAASSIRETTILRRSTPLLFYLFGANHITHGEGEGICACVFSFLVLLCSCFFIFIIVQPAVSIMSSSSFVVTAIVTMSGLWGVWNSDASVAAAAGTGSYRIRSRPPPGTTHQQPSRSSSTGMSRSSNTNNNNNWQDVYIAGFLALSDHEIEAPLGQGVMPAITLALRHLANSSFLHDYRLRLLYNDTQVLHHPVCFLRPSFSLVSHLSHDDDADGT